MGGGPSRRDNEGGPQTTEPARKERPHRPGKAQPQQPPLPRHSRNRDAGRCSPETATRADAVDRYATKTVAPVRSQPVSTPNPVPGRPPRNRTTSTSPSTAGSNRRPAPTPGGHRPEYRRSGTNPPRCTTTRRATPARPLRGQARSYPYRRTRHSAHDIHRLAGQPACRAPRTWPTIAGQLSLTGTGGTAVRSRRLRPHRADDRMPVAQVRVELADLGKVVVEAVLVVFLVLHRAVRNSTSSGSLNSAAANAAACNGPVPCGVTGRKRPHHPGCSWPANTS